MAGDMAGFTFLSGPPPYPAAAPKKIPAPSAAVPVVLHTAPLPRSRASRRRGLSSNRPGIGLRSLSNPALRFPGESRDPSPPRIPAVAGKRKGQRTRALTGAGTGRFFHDQSVPFVRPEIGRKTHVRAGLQEHRRRAAQRGGLHHRIGRHRADLVAAVSQYLDGLERDRATDAALEGRKHALILDEPAAGGIAGPALGDLPPPSHAPCSNLGQRSIRPHTKAGHMTPTDQTHARCTALASRGPSTDGLSGSPNPSQPDAGAGLRCAQPILQVRAGESDDFASSPK